MNINSSQTLSKKKRRGRTTSPLTLYGWYYSHSLPYIRASQVGQWLRFHAPHARSMGLIPGGMTRFCMPQLRPVCLVAQSCLTLCNPMDCSPPGSSVLGISQARILEQVAISFSRGSSLPVLHSQHHLGSPAKTWCSQINFF